MQTSVGRRAWYDFPRIGPCEVCLKRGRRQAHHVVREQDIRREAPGRRWDVANRMLVGIFCGCHYSHSMYGVNNTKISYSKVPKASIGFAIEVLGEGPALEYFRRYYRDAP